MSATITAAQRRRDELLLARYRAAPSENLLRELVERYRPLARSLAMRYRAGKEPMEDLMQVADLGLVAAIKGYDPDRGKSFSAYAVPTILGEIRHHFRDKVWNLRLPRALQESTAAVDKAAAASPRTSAARRPSPRSPRRPSSPKLLSSRLSRRRKPATPSRSTASIPTTTRRPRSTQFGARDLGYDRVEAKLASRSADLDARELKVLQMRFQKGMTQREIGVQLGVSQMQVSRISRAGLQKLVGAVRGDRQPASRVAA